MENHELARILPSIRKLPSTAKSVDMMEDFLLDVKLRRASRTHENYRAICTDFLNFIGDLPLASVRPVDIREFLAWLSEQGASHNTLVQKRYALGAFFKHLEMLSVVPTSPCRSVGVRKWKRKLPETLTREQIDRLIAATENARDRAIVRTLYSTGCRLSELTGMRIENISWDDRPAAKILGKGDKERLVPLNTRAAAALRSVIGKRKSGFVFESTQRPLGRGTLCVDRGGDWRLVYHERIKGPDGETCCRKHSKALGRALSVAPRVHLTRNQYYEFWALSWAERSEQATKWKVRHTRFIGSAKSMNRAEAQARADAFLERQFGPNARRSLPTITREEAEAAAGKFLTEMLKRPADPRAERPLAKHAIYNVIRSAGLRAGLGDVHPHMIRHAFALHLLEGGADLVAIQRLMGHESLSTTQIYLRVSQKHLLETMQKYHPHFGGKP